MVGHLENLTVAHVPEGAIDIADRGDAQGDGLDIAKDAIAQINHVTNAVLVLNEHEDARKEVLHQRLCTKAEGNADDTGGGNKRRYVDL